MKKYIILAGIALVASASFAHAQTYSFTNDLSLGSRGTDVVQLQNWLIANGFAIPAITANPSLAGYFGTQTQSALAAYQRSINLPAYGYFGQLTRNYLNGRGGSVIPGSLSLTITNSPSNLSAGQTGTWTLVANGVQGNSNLNYSVTWGDENVYTAAQVQQNVALPQTNQTATFTHAYSASGVYSVTFTVRDNARGTSATKTTQVTVGSVATSFQITSPNGGESWQAGTSHTITWTAPQYFAPTYVDISLMPNQSCGAQVCTLMYRLPFPIANHVSIDQHSYTWNVGTYIQAICGQGVACNNSSIPDGQYKIQICQSGTTNACDTSDNYFNIYTSSQSGSIQPVINGVDAPTTLSVGQTGTWSVRATDPLNGYLSYSVTWGDEQTIYPVAGTAVPTVASQNNVFTHVYSQPGLYTVTFTIRNSSGTTAQTSSTVNVTGATSAGPLRIVSPNGGEVWQKGTIHAITWTSPYYFVATNADLKVTQKYNCTTQVCPAIAYAPFTIATNIPINQNSYSWNVGTAMDFNSLYATLPEGQYTVQICQSGTNVCDSSDGTFTITSSSWIYPPAATQPPLICPAGYTCYPNR